MGWSPRSLGNVMRPHWLDLFFFPGEQKHKGREHIPKHVTILWDRICNPFKRSLSPIMLFGLQPHGGWKVSTLWVPGGAMKGSNPWKILKITGVARSFSTKKLSISLRQNGSQQKSLGPLPTEISELPCLAELQFFSVWKGQWPTHVPHSVQSKRVNETDRIFQVSGIWRVDGGPPQQTKRYLYLTKKHM